MNEWIFTSPIAPRSLPLVEPKEPGRDDDQEEGEGCEQGETILVPVQAFSTTAMIPWPCRLA